MNRVWTTAVAGVCLAVLIALPNLHSPGYTPALGFHLLTPLYDSVVSVTCQTATTTSVLIEQIQTEIKNNNLQNATILDVGCGTGTVISTLVRELRIPQKLRIYGVDIDDAVLKIARTKVHQQEDVVQFVQSSCDAITTVLSPESHQFDVQFSSMLFHHLTDAQKKQTLLEMYKLMSATGAAFLLDVGPSQTLFSKISYLFIQLFLDGFETTSSHEDGKIPLFIKDAGFQNVRTVAVFNTGCGTLELIRFSKR